MFSPDLKFESNSTTKLPLCRCQAQVVKHTFTVDEAQTMDKGEWTKAKLGMAELDLVHA